MDLKLRLFEEEEVIKNLVTQYLIFQAFCPSVTVCNSIKTDKNVGDILVLKCEVLHILLYLIKIC